MKKISSVPSWLDLSADRTQIIYNAYRADIINRIFSEAASGIGAYVIARRLNGEKIRSFGPSEEWIPSSISKILQNRAVLGEYQAKSMSTGKRLRVGEPIPDYYPRVISDELFNQAEVAKKTNLQKGTGRKGETFTNLFSGLLYCGKCSSKMRFQNRQTRLSFVCVASRLEKCDPVRWDYPDFEAGLLKCFSLNELMTFWPALAIQNEAFVASLRSGDVYKSRSSLNQALKNLVSRIEIGGEPILGEVGDAAFEAAGDRIFRIRAHATIGEAILTFRKV